MDLTKCLWSTTGKMQCPQRKTNVVEEFSNKAANGSRYSFNVIVYDKIGNITSVRKIVNEARYANKLVWKESEENRDKMGSEVKLVITDLTSYENLALDGSPSPLVLMLRQPNKATEIPVYFSDSPGLTRVYQRTIEIMLQDYEGYTLSFL